MASEQDATEFVDESYQAGEQAAQFLKTGKTDGLQREMVKVRKRVYNADAAKRYDIAIPANFEVVK